MKSSSQRKVSEPVMEMFLRIKHPMLDTASITQALGVEPEDCIDAGTTASKSGGQRVHSESYWIAQLDVPSMADMARNFASMSTTPSFSVAEVGGLMNATEYDMHLMIWLRKLEGKHAFFKELARCGGTATLLIQRNDHGTPVSLCKSLGKLAEFGIGVEID